MSSLGVTHNVGKNFVKLKIENKVSSKFICGSLNKYLILM